MQSNKNNRNLIYIQKEYVHNFMSLTFSIIGTILLLFVLVFSIVKDYTILIVYSSVFTAFMSARVIINIKLVFSFDKLVKKISPEHIEFYITKSWTRKREGAIWVGLMYIFTLLLLVTITAIVGNYYDSIHTVIISSVLVIHLFMIIIYMFANIQTLDSRIKISEKRIDIKSMEWIQIRADQSSYYKLLFVWYIHILFILPVVFMVIPGYRNMWNKISKN